MKTQIIFLSFFFLAGCFEPSVTQLGYVSTSSELQDTMELSSTETEDGIIAAYIDADSGFTQSLPVKIPGIGTLQISIPAGALAVSGDLFVAEAPGLAAELNALKASPAVFISASPNSVVGTLKSPLTLSLPLSVSMGFSDLNSRLVVLANDGSTIRLISDVIAESGYIRFRTAKFGSFQAVHVTSELQARFADKAEVKSTVRVAPAQVVIREEAAKVPPKEVAQEVLPPAGSGNNSNGPNDDEDNEQPATSPDDGSGNSGGGQANVPPPPPPPPGPTETEIQEVMTDLVYWMERYYSYGEPIQAAQLNYISNNPVKYQIAIERIKQGMNAYDVGVFKNFIYSMGLTETQITYWIEQLDNP